MRAIIVTVCIGVILLVSTVGAVAQSNDAWIPGLASFILPGVGQFINDEMDKAILHLGIVIGVDLLAYYAAALLPFTSMYAYPLIAAAHLGWGIYSGLDAYNVAKDNGFRFGLVENGLGFAVNF